MAKEILAAGTEAPDFKLSSSPDATFALSDLRGKRVIIAFYPGDWSYLSPPEVNPGADGILEALEELSEKTAGSRT